MTRAKIEIKMRFATAKKQNMRMPLKSSKMNWANFKTRRYGKVATHTPMEGKKKIVTRQKSPSVVSVLTPYLCSFR